MTSNHGKLGAFKNVRVRFQRLSDSKIFTGWTLDITPEYLRLQTTETENLHLQEAFSFDIPGNQTRLLFHATLENISPFCLTFLVADGLRFVDSQEPVRLKIKNTIVKIKVRNEEEKEQIIHEGILLDIAPRGIAFSLDQRIEPGTMIEVDFNTIAGRFQREGNIRYCKELSSNPFLYRMGVEFSAVNRIDLARWQQLFVKEVA